MKKDFSISEALSFGWSQTKINLTFFIKILLVYLLVFGLPQLITMQFSESSEVIAVVIVIIISIATTIFRIIFDIGLINIALKINDKQKVEVEDLYSKYNLILKYLIASILYGLMVGLGLILLIIPGIYLALRFQFFSYLIIDKNLGPIEALKQSSKMTRGVKLQLLLFGIVSGLINMVGVLALIVGLILTLPTTAIAQAHVYRKLLAKASSQ